MNDEVINMQKIRCHDGKCIDVGKNELTMQRADIIGLIEKDLLKSELGDSYDTGE